MRGQALDQGDGDVTRRAARHVVQDDGQPEVGDGGKVAVEPFGRRLVVVGRHLERRVCAAGLRGLRELDRLLRGVRAGAGDDLDTVGGVLGRDPDDFDVLLDGQRRRFAGGADRHDPGHPPGDLHVDQLAEADIVDGTVLVERRDDGGIGT